MVEHVLKSRKDNYSVNR